ncbi:MAG: hypothetical protein JXR77_18385 [Lentisphaeria bacterium]|nr:hypothetical protein [Lentisphaeria bacterium]
MTGLRSRIFATLVAVVALAVPGSAQWVCQQLSLRPGWNAVFLQVQPVDNACEAVFAGMPVESVWAWNRRYSPVRYLQDAEALSADQADWLTYFPAGSGAAAATDLFAVHGGRSYLVKLGGTQEVPWELSGRPVVRAPEWVPDSFNLVGLPVDAVAPPAVDAFFAPSASHRDHRLHRLSAAGTWEPVSNPGATPLPAAEAVWVYCTTPSDYEAPLSLRFGQGGGLDFGRKLTETTLVLCNHATAAKTVTLRPGPSESPPDDASPFLAGPVPLSRYRIDEEQIGWAALADAVTLTVPAAGELPVRLAVRRADMVPFVPPAGATTRSGVVYAGILEVSDGEGVAYRLPVSSEGLVSYSKAPDGSLEAEDPRVGLWVGSVSVDYVSDPARQTPEPDPPAGQPYAANIPEGGEFQLRLILHVDEALQARLVQQVTLMFQVGEYGPDPVNDGLRVVTQPGRHVLITDDALLGQYSGAALRDGQEVGRRISTAAYAFPYDPESGSRPSTQDLSGAFPEAPSVEFPAELGCSFTLDHDDPVNPFKHRYHPDHDNLDARFENPKAEAFDIQRTITLRFSDTDPEHPENPPTWWDTEVGGWYEETVHGIHKADITVKGTFRLERVSHVAALNGGAKR